MRVQAIGELLRIDRAEAVPKPSLTVQHGRRLCAERSVGAVEGNLMGRLYTIVHLTAGSMGIRPSIGHLRVRCEIEHYKDYELA